MTIAEKNLIFAVFTGAAIFVLLGGVFAVAATDFNSIAPLIISACIALLLIAIAGLFGPKPTQKRTTKSAKRAGYTPNNAPIRRAVAHPMLPAPKPMPAPQAETLPMSPQRQFEQPIVKAINDVWQFCTSGVNNAQLYSIDIGRPHWFSSSVVFPLSLTSSLRTPEHDALVMRRFQPALRDVLTNIARSEENKVKARQTSVEIVDGHYNVVVRAPGKAPDMHISKMIRYAKAGAQLGKADRTGDLYGLLGLDRKDEPVYLDMALTPVSLFVGKTGSGKTSAAMGMLTSLLSANSPDRVHLYVVAFRANQWRTFAELPHCKAVEYETGRITALCQRLADEAQQRAGIDADNSHPSVILFVDDLSGISKMDAWPDIRDALTQLTMSGGGARYYTVITTHRTTEAGGVGVGARAITLNAGARIATNTAGGPSIMADHLGVTQTQAENTPMPQARSEAAISFDGEPPTIVQTVYALGHEVADVLNIAEQNTAVDKQSVTQSRRGDGEYGRLHYTTTPQERNAYTDAYTGTTPTTPPITPEPHTENGHNGRGDVTKVDRYIDADTRRDVRARDGDICQWCNGEGSDDDGPDGHTWEYDHVIPVSRGGGNNIDNVVLSCRTCNRRKSDMLPADFVAERLLSADGVVPPVRKVGNRYRPSAWDSIQLWAASNVGRTVSDIAEMAMGNKSSHNVKRCREWIEAGKRLCESLRGQE